MVKKAEKKQNDKKDLTVEDDTETLDGLDKKTWETALKQLKTLFESPKEKKIENEPKQSVEKPVNTNRHAKTKEIIIEINCDTSCDCCKKIAECFENCPFFKTVLEEPEYDTISKS